MKLFKKTIFILLFFILTLSFTLNIKANDDIYVYLGGDAIGLKFNSGVEVMGKYSIKVDDELIEPWHSSLIDTGDTIIKINNQDVKTINDVEMILNKVNNELIKLEYVRDNKIYQTSIKPFISSDHQVSLGLYLKDETIGLGTLSFITKDQLFASLGHGIYKDNKLISFNSGNIVGVLINGIKRGTRSDAGSKMGVLQKEVVGNILTLTNNGAYGKLDLKHFKDKELVKIVKPNKVRCGQAYLYTVLNGKEITKININIEEVIKQDDILNKGIKFRITDEEAIKKCGGIVQGMSGSPILQDGLLVGITSHVILDDQKKGYAIYAYWMYKELTEQKGNYKVC